MEEGEAIEAPMLSGAIERAQRKVEVRNFDIRKHLLEYDNVMNQQRESIYGWRRRILGGEDMRQEYLDLALDQVEELVEGYVPEKGEPDLEAFAAEAHQQFGVDVDLQAELYQGNLNSDEVRQELTGLVEAKLEAQVAMFDDLLVKYPDLSVPRFDEYARAVMLQTLDQQWKDHLLAMDHLKEGIGLRGYAQRDPKIEYQREGYEKFVEMTNTIRARAVEQMFRVRFELPDPERLRAMRAAEEARRRSQERALREQHATGAALGSGAAAAGAASSERPQTVQRDGRKIGRNEACPCGSGKKYKKCCGKAA